MASKDRDDKDGGSKETNEKSRRAKDPSEGELTAVKQKRGEPADNLRRRAEWFKKRHGGS